MSLLDDFRSVISTIQKIDNIELYRQIVDLQSEAVEIVAENTQLRGRISDLEAKFEVRQKLRFEANAYWIGDTMETGDGPFCSNCYDQHQKLVRMLTLSNNNKWSECPTCEKQLRIPRRENDFNCADDSSEVSFSAPKRVRWGRGLDDF
jgi:hypothetical protein